MLAIAATRTGLDVALVVSAFGFGFRHGIDWDHLAAITDITSSQRDVRTGLRYATLYAAGHGAVVFAIGALAVAAGVKLPGSVDAVMARIVGVTLIVLGVYVFYALFRYGRDFRLRSRWMLIFTGVRNTYRRVRARRERGSHTVTHEHAHVEGGWFHHANGAHAGSGPGSVLTAHSHSHTHTDPFMNYGMGTSFFVGMLHGIGAETPTQLVIFLTAAGSGGAGTGIAVLLIFLAGLFASNTAVALASASGYLAATRRFTVYATVSVITAVASLAIGIAFLVSGGSWLPAIFGG